MPLALPEGDRSTRAADRKTLAASLAQLRRQYAGIKAQNTAGEPEERGVATVTPYPSWVPPRVPEPPPPGPTTPTTPSGDPGGYTSGFNEADWNRTATGGYINKYNPSLGYGLNGTPAPGTGWVMDNYGPPVWRRDYIAGPGGRPIIKGSDGYSGDYPLLSDAELAKWGITF